MPYKRVIYGDIDNGIFSSMMVFNKMVDGKSNYGAELPFDLKELSSQNHAFVVHGERYDKHTIGEVFLCYNQALSFAWLCSAINRSKELEEEFIYASEKKLEGVLNKVKREMELLTDSIEKLCLSNDIFVTKEHISKKDVSHDFIDENKVTYMLGSETMQISEYFLSNNTHFHITPVPIVLPLYKGEIHPLGKSEINYFSFK